MEDRDYLNEWAARYTGEPEQMVPNAVESGWYTDSPAAAAVVMFQSAREGKKVDLNINDGTVEVYCGDSLETGKIDELALLITRACYRCHHG